MRMKISRGVILKEALSVACDGSDQQVIRLLIADDQELVRTGIQLGLEAGGAVRVVADAVAGIRQLVCRPGAPSPPRPPWLGHGSVNRIESTTSSSRSAAAVSPAGNPTVK